MQPQTVSVHVRAFLTWLAIFPMVALGLTVMRLFAGWMHPILSAFFLTLIIVPLAVYVIVPNLIKLYLKVRRK